MNAAILIAGLTFALMGIVRTQSSDVDGPLFLSPYIRDGKLQTAIDLSRVHAKEFGIELQSHSAFLTVGATNDIHYYFWYFRAMENPSGAPFVVWMDGGPGISSLVGLFGEVGPYYVNEDGRLKWREINWVTKYNMIFLDAPPGTGFSFSSGDSNAVNTTRHVSDNLADVLDQFFILFPPNVSQEVYVLGQGYGAKHAIALAHLVTTSRRQYSFNLNGILSMSGSFDLIHQFRPAEVLYQTGVITAVGRNSINNDLQRYRRLMGQRRYVEGSRQISNIINGFLSPTDSIFNRESGITNSITILRDVALPEELSFIPFIDNSPKLKRALHVGSNTKYSANHQQLKDRFIETGDYGKPVSRELEVILDLDVKVLMYAGNMEPYIVVVPSYELAKSLKWRCQHQFVHVSNRQIWRVNENDLNGAGYVKCACNFCHATVRNAGYMIPTEEPIRSFDLVDRFIHNRRFGTYVL